MPSPSGLITLTSDFGDGWYTGAMRGAVLGVNPRATLVDLTHAVTPTNVLEGAFALAAACDAFPDGAVHLVVIDPGVGTARGALVIETDRFLFVGPDNGVLALAAPPPARRRARFIENSRYFVPDPSPTFHGRDVFAPVAAHLSLGVDAAEMGPEAPAPRALDLPPVRRTPSGWTGEVILADAFGNLVTNIHPGRLGRETPAPTPEGAWEVWLEGRPIGRLRRTYGDAAPGEALALIGSHGFLEIAVSGGSATSTLAGDAFARVRYAGLRPPRLEVRLDVRGETRTR